jgi:hypothetical protein
MSGIFSALGIGVSVTIIAMDGGFSGLTFNHEST